MKKPTIRFNGTKDDPAKIIELVSGKLAWKARAEMVASAPSLLDTEKLKAYREEHKIIMTDKMRNIDAFIERARKPWDMEGVLAILEERVTLIDLDKAYGKIGNRWTKLR